MDSSRVLKKTIKRAQKEVKELLAEVKATKHNMSKLETGLKEVRSALKVLDIHAFRHDPE
jgi:cell division protein FtsB